MELSMGGFLIAAFFLQSMRRTRGGIPRLRLGMTRGACSKPLSFRAEGEESLTPFWDALIFEALKPLKY